MIRANMIRSKLSGQTSKPREYGRLRVRKIGFSSQTLLFRDCVSMRGRRRKKKGKKKKRKKKRKKKWKNHFSRFLATLDTLRSSLNELITNCYSIAGWKKGRRRPVKSRGIVQKNVLVSREFRSYAIVDRAIRNYLKIYNRRAIVMNRYDRAARVLDELARLWNKKNRHRSSPRSSGSTDFLFVSCLFPLLFFPF